MSILEKSCKSCLCSSQSELIRRSRHAPFALQFFEVRQHGQFGQLMHVFRHVGVDGFDDLRDRARSRRDGADGRQEVLYIRPHWPIEDACVDLKGYDVPILPASGVMQAAVYWALVAETCGAAPPVQHQPETRRGQLTLTSRTPGE